MDILKFTSLSCVYQLRLGSLYYVGQSGDVISRLKTHLSELRAGIHPNQELLEIFRTTNEELEAIILEECEEHERLDKEVFWVKTLRDQGLCVANVQHPWQGRSKRINGVSVDRSKKIKGKVLPFDYAKLPVQKLNIRVCYSDEP